MAQQRELTTAELDELLSLKAKVDKQKAKERRYWAEQAILLQKARKAGITASDQEVDQYMKTMRTKTRR